MQREEQDHTFTSRSGAFSVTITASSRGMARFILVGVPALALLAVASCVIGAAS